LLGTLGQPAGIPELLRLVDDLPQSSLYRNLTVLQDAGVVARVMSSQDGGLYELAEHITGHHHHLLCSQCGVVKDVVVPDALEHDLDTTLAKLAKREGFALDRHRLDLIGRCASCQ
jgi:Fur family transcriptional regulator, ferric uptake regulator